MIESINVLLWGQLLGVVSINPDRPGNYLFQYADESQTVEPSPLLMPVSDTIYEFSLNRTTYQGLPGMIADSLPDKFGNSLVDQYMASKGVTKSDVTVLDRLAYMGKRAMGALEFEPVTYDIDEPLHPLAMSDLVESARKAIQGKFSEVGSDLIQVGSSAGGARPKAVIGMNRDTDDIVSGQFDLPEGYEHWLLKFDGVGEDSELGGSEGYGRIEYIYYLMAKEAGIKMSKCDLLEDGERAHFMTKRFDRIGNEKLHMQSFCAIAHQDFNQPYVTEYSTLMRVAQQLNLGKSDLNQIYKRMVFNVLSNNCDDHTKNFSFLMNREGEWSLASAYDVTHAHNPQPDKWTKQHQMLVNSKAAIEDIMLEDLLAVGKQFRIHKAPQYITKIIEALSEWDTLANKYGVPDGQKSSIGNELSSNMARM